MIPSLGIVSDSRVSYAALCTKCFEMCGLGAYLLPVETALPTMEHPFQFGDQHCAADGVLDVREGDHSPDCGASPCRP